jgi:hypothetical protein
MKTLPLVLRDAAHLLGANEQLFLPGGQPYTLFYVQYEIKCEILA